MIRNALALFVAAGMLFAVEDWPRFRGPNGAGVSTERNLPGELDPAKNLMWKVELPQGGSSPIVAGGRVWITAYEGDERRVICLDAKSGKRLWERTVKKARTEMGNPMNGPATPSPVTDGKNVFAFFPDAGLVSFDNAGNQRWNNVLGPFRSMHGLSSSLELVDGKLVLLADQLDKSHLEVFDATSGKSVWRVDRINGLTGGYSTPAIWRPVRGATQLIVAGPLELAGYEVTSGKKIWWVSGLTNAPVGVPVVQGDIVYLNEPVGEPIPFQMVAGNDKNKDGKIASDELTDAGFIAFMQNLDRDWGNKDGAVEESEWRKSFDQFNGKGGLAAVKLGGAGDLTKTHILWKYAKSGTYVPSLLTYQNVGYLIRDGGILTAIDAEKGTLLKQGRLEGAIDKYYASPVAGDGKVYFLSESGKLTVIKAGAAWEKIATTDLAESGFATPAIARGRLYVRTAKALYCFGGKA